MSIQRQNISNETSALYSTGDRIDRYAADALKKLGSQINDLATLLSASTSTNSNTVTIAHA